MPNLGLQLSRTSDFFVGGGFLPTNLSNLLVWLDAGEGVLNIEGNNLTDSNRTFTLSGFPTSPAGGSVNGLATPTGSIQNGRNSYNVPWSGNPDGGYASMYWNINNWYLEATEFDGENTNNYVYTASGNTTYPWQATWTDGTLTPTATTVDVPATDNQTVAKWVNKVGIRSLTQDTLGLQPQFRNLGNGNVYVRFNTDYLFGENVAPQPDWGSSWSYYVVSTPMTAVGQSGTIPRYVLGHSGGAFARGGFGSTSSSLAIRNGSSSLFTTPTVTSGLTENPNATYVFSARVSSVGFYLGNNSTFVARSTSVSSSNQRTLYLGTLGGSSSDSIVSGNIKEVLAYQQTHTDQEANLVIGYLAQKWGVTL